MAFILPFENTFTIFLESMCSDQKYNDNDGEHSQPGWERCVATKEKLTRRACGGGDVHGVRETWSPSAAAAAAGAAPGLRVEVRFFRFALFHLFFLRVNRFQRHPRFGDELVGIGVGDFLQ